MQKKTIEEWAVEYGIEVLDPDGFDRSDPDLMNKKFTRDEFLDGIIFCTIQFYKDSKLKQEWDL